MNYILIIFVMWSYGLSEPASGEFSDEQACVNAAMDIYQKVQASSQLMDPPLVVWGCAPKATRARQ